MAGVEDLKYNLTARLPGTKFLADDPNVVTPGQKLNAAVGQFFGNLGATVGPVASDFGRGVKEIAGIPRTIYEGTQTPAQTTKPFVGGVESAVNPALLNLARGVNGSAPMIKANATPKAPDNTTQTDFGASYSPERMAGARDTFNALRFNQPLGVEGALSLNKGMSEEDLADWRARGVKLGVIGATQAANPNISNEELYNSKHPEYVALEKERANPNNARFNAIADQIKDINTFLSSDPLTRKYQILQMGVLTKAMNELGPLTSYGHFGVEGMKNEVAKGHLGVAEGELGVKKSTLELAKTKEAREATESVAKGDYYKANAEESKAKAKYYGDQDKPGKFETQAQQAWLKGYDDYLKSDTVLQDIMSKEDPAERATAIENHKALYRQLNPPAPIRKVDNPDGTITVTFADGTVQKMRKKGAQ